MRLTVSHLTDDFLPAHRSSIRMRCKSQNIQTGEIKITPQPLTLPSNGFVERKSLRMKGRRTKKNAIVCTRTNSHTYTDTHTHSNTSNIDRNKNTFNIHMYVRMYCVFVCIGRRRPRTNQHTQPILWVSLRVRNRHTHTHNTQRG